MPWTALEDQELIDFRSLPRDWPLATRAGCGLSATVRFKSQSMTDAAASSKPTPQNASLVPTHEESELIQRLQAGDQLAFEALVRELGPKVLAFVRRITQHDADAEDVLQEAFLSVFRHIGTFDGRSTLSTWVHRIAVNAALSKARRRAEPAADIDSLMPQFEAGFHKSPPRVLQVRDDFDQQSAAQQSILAAIDKLPDEYRQIVHMHSIAEMSFRSIAMALDISESLARQRLHRARLALMNLLQQQGDLHPASGASSPAHHGRVSP